MHVTAKLSRRFYEQFGDELMFCAKPSAFSSR